MSPTSFGRSGLRASSARSPLTPGRAALIALIGRYLAGMMDTSITLLEIHKLMCFLQRAGEPLRLRYTKALYGPYAENLRHVLTEVNGQFVTGLVAGDDPSTELQLVPGALEQAEPSVRVSTGGTLGRANSPRSRLNSRLSDFGAPGSAQSRADHDRALHRFRDTARDGRS